MESPKFTSGEWFVSNDDQIVSMPSQCKIANRISGWNYEEAKANAKLIAAAPDLFDALETMMIGLMDCGNVPNDGHSTIRTGFTVEVLLKAQQALKKATE